MSFRFRPGKSQHGALVKLGTDIRKGGKVSYIVDADIKGFFGATSCDFFRNCHWI